MMQTSTLMNESAPHVHPAIPAQYHATLDLEKSMGALAGAGDLFSVETLLELDEAEDFPEEAWRFLNEWGLTHYYVPADLGGKLESFEQVFSMIRAVSRRDLTLAIAHGKTYLGSVCVWLGGSIEQQKRLSQIILDNYPVSLGLTEKDHGSDLSASEVVAVADDTGYALDGKKWLINNATRGRAITVFAKTPGENDSRSHSIFLVDKHALPEKCYAPLPKLRTHGIRGADISGIRFTQAPLSRDCLIGKEGAGLEIALKGLQVSRTMCASLSLGCADTALRMTLDFALRRKLYGKTVFDLPHAQNQLMQAFLDILICDCVSTAGSRALHNLPEFMSVYSSAIKYFVPTTVEEQISNLSVILGARHYLREAGEHGLFQKIVRDNAIVSLFDGSTVVNLQAIAIQLQNIAKATPSDTGTIAFPGRDKLPKTFNLLEPLETFSAGRLRLINYRNQDPIVSGLDDSLKRVEALLENRLIDSDIGIVLLNTIRRVIYHRDLEREEVLRLEPMSTPLSAQAFEHAKKYCTVFAAACCVHTWLYNRDRFDADFASPEWLIACLSRLLARFEPADPIPESVRSKTISVMRSLHDGKRLFSTNPLELH